MTKGLGKDFTERFINNIFKKSNETPNTKKKGWKSPFGSQKVLLHFGEYYYLKVIVNNNFCSAWNITGNATPIITLSLFLFVRIQTLKNNQNWWKEQGSVFRKGYWTMNFWLLWSSELWILFLKNLGKSFCPPDPAIRHT